MIIRLYKGIILDALNTIHIWHTGHHNYFWCKYISSWNWVRIGQVSTNLGYGDIRQISTWYIPQNLCIRKMENGEWHPFQVTSRLISNGIVLVLSVFFSALLHWYRSQLVQCVAYSQCGSINCSINMASDASAFVANYRKLYFPYNEI